MQTQIMQKPDSYFSHEPLNKNNRAVEERGERPPKGIQRVVCRMAAECCAEGDAEEWQEAALSLHAPPIASFSYL